MAGLTWDQRTRLAYLIIETKRRLQEERTLNYLPYRPQIRFHATGRNFRHRLFQAGNQLGKTKSMMEEVAFHLRGRYPTGWRGKVYPKAVNFIVSGETYVLMRDTLMKMLFESTQAMKTGKDYNGMVPHRDLIRWQTNTQVSGALDYVETRHSTGGVSRVKFLSYEQGRKSFQAVTIDEAFLDEEPPPAIYEEVIIRSSNGQLKRQSTMTFTPMQGRTSVVRRFEKEEDRLEKSRSRTMMGIWDVGHYNAKEKRDYLNDYEPHTREARGFGKAVAGDGAVFPLNARALRVQVPAPEGDWWWLAGIDFGYTHPAACVQMLRSPEGVFYVANTWSGKRKSPTQIARAVGNWGSPPFVWPHDGNRKDQYKAEGKGIWTLFEEEGMRMASSHVLNPSGDNRKSWGLSKMLTLMQDDKFKVSYKLTDWFDEFESYHYMENGRPTDEFDDLMSATRYCIMGFHTGMAERIVRKKMRDTQTQDEEESWMAQ